MPHDGHAGDAEHPGQLIHRDLEGARARAGTGGRLRIGGRPGRVERHVPFHLLNDLMNVPVQYGHRAETAQLAHEPIRVTRAPAPGLIDGPQRHVGKDHDGVLSERPCKSAASQASWSVPRVPRPPGLNCSTVISATKGTPAWSKL